MPKKEKKEQDDETVTSGKMSARDKKELQEGACVNCALASIVLTVALYLLAAIL